MGIEYAVTDKYTECGYGRSASFHDSTNIALLEAIERYSSLFYPYQNKDIYAKFSDLDNAIHPQEFHSPIFWKKSFYAVHDNLEIYWTEAESLRR